MFRMSLHKFVLLYSKCVLPKNTICRMLTYLCMHVGGGEVGGGGQEMGVSNAQFNLGNTELN